jgi:hypothetical protein
MHTRYWIHREIASRLQIQRRKFSTSNQLCESLFTDSQDMLVLSSNVASRYCNCCTDGSTSPGNYGYHLEYMSRIILKINADFFR